MPDPALGPIPSHILALGVDPASVPTAAEIAAVPRHQGRTIETIASSGQVKIIDLGAGTSLDVFWRLDGAGITVGLRMYILHRGYDLGSQTIDPNHPTVTIRGPDIAGYQAIVSAGVDTARCVLFIRATFRAGWPIDDTFTGEVAVPYARPFPPLTTGSVVADGITPEMAAAIRAAPSTPFRQPTPGFIQRDPVTTAAVSTLLWLVNAAGYVTSVRLTAEALAAADEGFSPSDLLFAIGIAGQGGVGLGVEAAAGFYITGGGEVGWFGSGGIDIGAFASISIGVPVYVYWTGTRGFGGTSMGINIGVGKSLGPKCPVGVGVTVSVYWSLGQPQSSLPAGFCVNFSIGASPIPVQAYASFGYTYVGKLAQVWGKQEGEVVHFRGILPPEPAPLLP
jgi:hypothetical protein